jgi:hypothetical protein
MKHSAAIPLPLKTIRQVAADAEVNEKTALRVLVGNPVRPGGKERVLAALRLRGITLPLRTADE